MKRENEKIKTVVYCVVSGVAFLIGLYLFCVVLKNGIDKEKARQSAEFEIPVNAVAVIQNHVDFESDENDLVVYCETDENLHDWWNPEEATIVWVDSEAATDVSVEYEQVGDMVERVAEESPSNAVPVRDIGSPDPFWNELLWDSRGATAERWEIEECIRELMLEAGGESEEDIREHAAVYCKRLLYTQTVGGYDDWGTTLHEVVHSHGFLETYPFIWEERAIPTETVREIFWDVWNNGYDTDFRVQNFRTEYYHSLKWSIPAYQIGKTFYSINIYQDFSMFE